MSKLETLHQRAPPVQVNARYFLRFARARIIAVARPPAISDITLGSGTDTVYAVAVPALAALANRKRPVAHSDVVVRLSKEFSFFIANPRKIRCLGCVSNIDAK